MKRLLLVIIIFISFFLVSCENFSVQTTDFGTSTKVYTTQDSNISRILYAIENYDFSNTNGFDYQVSQEYQGVVTNTLSIEQRIDRSDSIKIYTEEVTTSLLEFNIDQAHSTEEHLSFYFNNQKGTCDSENKLIWKEETLSNYLNRSLPIEAISLSDFNQFQVEFVDEFIVLSGDIKHESISQILTLDATNISTLNLTIKLNLDDDSLNEIQIFFEQDMTQTNIIFRPYNDDTQVIIPQS